MKKYRAWRPKRKRKSWQRRTRNPCRVAVPYPLDVLKGGEHMQGINNKLKDILEKLTDFFENFVDELAEVKTNETTALSHLQTIAANTAK